MQRRDEHIIELDALVDRLGSNLEKGLDSAKAKMLQTRFGKNTFTFPSSVNEGVIAIKVIFTCITLFAWTAAGWFWASSPLIWTVVVALIIMMTITYIISTIRDYKSNFIWQGLKSLLPQTAVVIRDEKRVRIDASNLVPGDIVMVSEGAIVPADLRVIQLEEITRIDNSKLCGSNATIVCTVVASSEELLDSTNMVWATSRCLTGGLTGIVIMTGDRTTYGRLLAELNATRSIALPIRMLIYREVMRAVLLSIATVFVGSLVFGVGMNVPRWVAATKAITASS